MQIRNKMIKYIDNFVMISFVSLLLEKVAN